MEIIKRKEIYINPSTKLNESYIYSSNSDSNQISDEIIYTKGQRRIYNPMKENRAKKRTSKYRYNIPLTQKEESDNENSEISDNKKIFTTITPNFNRDNNNKENFNDVNDFINNENKTQCNINKRLSQNNGVYKKLKTPDKKYTYYRKKKKKNSNNNTYSISCYTESSNPNNNSNIYDSLNEEHGNIKQEDYSKKINRLIKGGLKFELNNENNNYIDLLTISDIKTLEDKINMQKLSRSKYSQKNKINNPESNNIYIRKTYNKKPIQLNINESKESIVNYKSRNKLAKTITNGNIGHKSYDCTTFKKKIGINKKRKMKQNNKNNNSTDKYYTDLRKTKRKSKGTPIKKENDKGGKIILRPKLFSKKKLYAIILIQNWWRKNHLKFIKKIIMIQRAIRDLLNKNKKKIYKNNNIDEEKVKLIQRKFRQYLNNKKNNENNLKNIIKYIPKDICQIEKIRIRPIIHKKDKKENQTDNKGKLRQKKNINNIRTIKNQNINNKDNLNKNKVIPIGKKQNIDKHKLSVSPLNKILISPDQVRYETERYTFMKRCYYRNREEDKEENRINRLYTTEFMRKINLKIKGKWLTPDKINKKVNPLLKIDNLNEEGNIQFLSGKKKKNKQSNKDNYENNNKILKLEKTTYDRIIGFNEKKEPEIQKNKDVLENINDLVEPVNITDEIITKCKMEEIIICDNKNKNSLNLEDNDAKEEKEKDEDKKDEIKDEETKEEKEKEDKKEEKAKEEEEIKEEVAIKKEEQNIEIKEEDKNEEIKEEENKKNDKENEYEKNIDKIIVIQKNIKIFLEKLKPKIIKNKKTLLVQDKKEEKVPNIQEKEEKDIYIKKKNINKSQIIKNIHTVQKLIKNENKNSESNEVSNINNEQNNINAKEKNRDSIDENSIIENLKENEDINNQNKNQIDDNTNNDININENKNIDMKYITKKPTKSHNIISANINNTFDNKEMIYINKLPSKAHNIINNNINNKTQTNEMEYINKLPSKAFNIITNRQNELNNNTEMEYIIKKPSKAFNINTALNKNLDSNGVEYIKKQTCKAFNMNNIKNDIIENIKESVNNSINIEINRNSCPIKEVKQISYKKYNRDYLENLLNNNVTNVNQLKEMSEKNKYFKFDYIAKMFVQKVQKINKQFVFYVIKGEGFSKFNIIYFDIIKTYLKNKNLYINDNNDVSKLLKDTLESYSNIYDECKGAIIPYIKESDEEKLINTELFRHDENCNNLIAFISKYLKLEKNLTEFSEDLIKYHLKKIPIRNFNIFGITRYINFIIRPLLFSKGSKIGDTKDNKNLNLDYIYIQAEDNKEQDDFYEYSIDLNNSENDIKNKKYVRKTLNYKKGKKLSMTRHVKNISSCDINNNSNDNIINVNDSLTKKNVYK